MKTLHVGEAEGQLAQLIAEAHEGQTIVLTDGQKKVWLETHRPPDGAWENPELEAELLQAADGPFTPYSSAEMRRIVERIIREEQRP